MVRRLTKKQQRLAESALEVVPRAIQGFCRAYPGIRRKLDRIDSVEVAHLAVVRAAKTYDSEKSKVTTYFTMAIFNALLKELAREQRQALDSWSRVPLEMADGLAKADGISKEMRNALASIPEESRSVLHDRYFSGRTLGDMAEEYGIDRRTVRRRIESAVVQLSAAWDELDALR